MIEFSAAFALIAGFVLYPIAALASLGVIAARLNFENSDLVSKVALSASFGEALNRCSDRKLRLQGLSMFPICPVGGLKDCGSDLFVVVQNKTSGTTSEIGPNKYLSQAIDTSTNIYLYRVITRAKCGPLLPHLVRLLPPVPGLTQPAILRFSTSRTIERPESATFVEGRAI